MDPVGILPTGFPVYRLMLKYRLNRAGQGGVLPVFVAAVGMLAFLFYWAGFPLQMILFVLIAGVIFVMAFVNTDFALIIYIFAMLFSPQFAVGDVPGRAVVIRADDLFLAVIFFAWIAKMAINKELGLLRTSPVNQPLLAYIAIAVISTLSGVLVGHARWKTSFFYLFKYLEYFLLYFMVTNNIKSFKQVKNFVFSIILVGVITGFYAWYQHYSGVERASTPFQTEANTLGGYLLLLMMVVAGFFLNTSHFRMRMTALGILGIFFPAFLYTLSRGSWFGFLPALLALFVLTRKGRGAIIVFLLVAILAPAFIFPHYVQKRFSETFQSHDPASRQYRVLGKRIYLDESASARVESWKYAFGMLSKSPVLGSGVGSAIPVVENQYARVLVEVGIVGFLCFAWLLFTVFKGALHVLREFREDEFANGLATGFLAGFVGLLFHSLSAETFIIIRIMEPFWFLAAVIIMLPVVLKPLKADQAVSLETT